MIELQVIILMLPGLIISAFVFLWASTDHERSVQERTRQDTRRGG
jgi:hypothetical protein